MLLIFNPWMFKHAFVFGDFFQVIFIAWGVEYSNTNKEKHLKNTKFLK